MEKYSERCEVVKIRKVLAVLVSLFLLSLIPFEAFANQSNKPDKPGIKIQLTQQQYNDLKAKGKLPTNYPIEIKKEQKLPSGSVEVQDALHKTKFGQMILKEYGEDLSKVTDLGGGNKVVETISFTYWKYPKGYQPSDQKTASIGGKIQNLLTPSACASCTTPSAHIDSSIQKTYYAGSSMEAQEVLGYHVDEYEDQNLFNYYKHTSQSTAYWWRTATEYTIKNAYFAFNIVGNELCSSNRNPYNASTYNFTPDWIDTNYSYTYSFTGNYTTWPPLNDGDSAFTYHKITGDLYRYSSLIISAWPASYDVYN